MMPSLHAPEMILDLPFDHKVDIWAFGCVIWLFITGGPMFDNLWWTGFYDEQEQQSHHLLQMTQVLGPLPEALLMKWPGRGKYFAADGTPVKKSGHDQGGSNQSKPLPPMNEVLKALDLPGMGEKEKMQVEELLRWTLNYDPAKRPSTAELLEHEWFKESPGSE